MDSTLGNSATTLGIVQSKLISILERSSIGTRYINFLDLEKTICPSGQCLRVGNGVEIYLAGDPERLTGQGSKKLQLQIEGAISIQNSG